MKLRRLDLFAFGPFHDVSLDFTDVEAGFHLIYGPNEAGKSTALRAISGLLYGIPRHTRDAHRHGMKNLRVGGTLAGEDGQKLTVIRRKGDKNTLLAADETVLDERELTRFLSGVDAELFHTMFGLDQGTLRDGGRALLEGKGNVGESLFDAGTGGRGIHGVLEALREEARALFRERGSKPKINAAIAELKEARKEVRDHAVSPIKWTEQKKDLERLRSQRRELDDKRASAVEEKLRLERVHRALGPATERARLLTALSDLGAVPELEEHAVERRQAAESTLREARAQLAQLEAEIARLDERRAQLEAPQSFAPSDEPRFEELADRLGGYKKAHVDLPRVRAEAEGLEIEARTLLRRLAWGDDLEGIGHRRLASGVVASVRGLAGRYDALVKRLADAREYRLDAERRRSSARARLEALDGGSEERRALADAVGRVERRSELDARLERLALDSAHLEAEMDRSKRALGCSTWSPAELAAAPVPSPETLERFERRWSQQEADETRLEEREQELVNRRDALDQRAAELAYGGEVPTEADLERARGERDAQWHAIRRTLTKDAPHDDGGAPRSELAPTDPSPLVAPYEQAVASADELSDRLRREAERVSVRARLEAEREDVERQTARLSERRQELDASRRRLEAEWGQRWSAVDLAAASPAEMRGWLTQHRSLVEQVQRIDALRREHEALSRERAELARLLRRALNEPEVPVDDGVSPSSGEIPAHLDASEPTEAGSTATSPRSSVALASLYDQARRRLAELEEREQERRDASSMAAELERERERWADTEAERQRELDAWQSEWAKAVAPLGLDATASPEQASAMLDDAVALFHKLDEASGARRRVAGMERDAAELERLVRDLGAEYAPDVVQLPVAGAAETLLERHRRAAHAQVEREQIEQQLAERRGEAEKVRERSRRAEQELATLQERAGVSDLESLVETEARARKATELRRRLEAEEARLREIGEGLSVEALVAETQDVDGPSLRRRIQELESELEELADQIHGLAEDIGSKQAGLERREQVDASRAADAAVRAEEAAARVREHTKRYVRARLAAVVLEQEIERYRERNQGPIIARANALFPKLTRGSFTGLKVDYDERDEHVLRCARPDGQLVGVEGLSDGSRDQLYLALRLASLESFAEHTAPLPLVLDDVLIHFDDDRSKAALEVLGELAPRLQILFFTHHERLVELAGESVPEARLRVHRLDSAVREADRSPGDLILEHP